MQNHFYVYILKCVNGAYYVGNTDNIEKRMSEHDQGLISTCYTTNRRPVELIFLQLFPTRDAAFQAERQIKGWSRKKKEALIENNWDKIKELNKNQKRRSILQQVQDERSEELNECLLVRKSVVALCEDGSLSNHQDERGGEIEIDQA